jgi:hypothetical protein
VQFICPSDPRKATVSKTIDSAIRIQSMHSNWLKIEERIHILDQRKLKAEKARKREPLRVIRGKKIFKDPPEVTKQSTLLFKRNK